MTARMPVKLANESALMVYRFTWTSADRTPMEVQWAEGTGNPLMFRGHAVAEIARPERFGWKVPRKVADFKRFAQAVADEWEAGYDDDELEDPDEDAPGYGLYGDPDGYDRNGAYDGFQVTSDAEGGL
jgi:hypothetical protein